MSSVALTADTFEPTVENPAGIDPTKDSGIVLVDWWASWCGPCRNFAPVFEQAAEKHADVIFGKVDTEAEQELAGAAQISSIPTLMAFRDGILVFRQPGALPAQALETVIEKVRELDMDDVRRQRDEQLAQESAQA
jgi:thioredoxin 1